MEQKLLLGGLSVGLAALGVSALLCAAPAAAQRLDAATVGKAIADAKHEMLWAELQAPAAGFALHNDALEARFSEFGGPKGESIILDLYVVVKAPAANEHGYWIAVYAQKRADWVTVEDWKMIADADVLRTAWALEAEGRRWLRKSCLENAPAAKDCDDIDQVAAFKRAPKAPYPGRGSETP